MASTPDPTVDPAILSQTQQALNTQIASSPPYSQSQGTLVPDGSQAALFLNSAQATHMPSTSMAPPPRTVNDLDACSEEDLFALQRPLQEQVAVKEAAKKRKAEAIEEINRLKRALRSF